MAANRHQQTLMPEDAELLRGQRRVKSAGFAGKAVADRRNEACSV